MAAWIEPVIKETSSEKQRTNNQQFSTKNTELPFSFYKILKFV
jgi:hypothetical protein